MSPLGFNDSVREDDGDQEFFSGTLTRNAQARRRGRSTNAPSPIGPVGPARDALCDPINPFDNRGLGVADVDIESDSEPEDSQGINVLARDSKETTEATMMDLDYATWSIPSQMRHRYSGESRGDGAPTYFEAADTKPPDGVHPAHSNLEFRKMQRLQPDRVTGQQSQPWESLEQLKKDFLNRHAHLPEEQRQSLWLQDVFGFANDTNVPIRDHESKLVKPSYYQDGQPAITKTDEPTGLSNPPINATKSTTRSQSYQTEGQFTDGGLVPTAPLKGIDGDTPLSSMYMRYTISQDYSKTSIESHKLSRLAAIRDRSICLIPKKCDM